MKYFLTITALFLGSCYPVKTSAQVIALDEGTTRAVVIGISDYQSPNIPDLRFADKDARAFAEWLRSPAGGAISDENIRLLTNEQATNARIGADLDWLVEVSQEGDEAIIYFSGHGDVETKTFSQFGFLLAWDSPPINYKVGAYSIVYLQDVISTLSNLKKARVAIITDACHSGKLAGSTIGGTQATAQSLAKQFANEVKIMSCQPNEVSLEGEQWGGGRGAFSFHLLDGMTGLADRNADGWVNLFEIGRYLQDKVFEETEQAQLPTTAGDPKGNLARVDAETLTKLVEEKKSESVALSRLTSKGMEDNALATVDSASQELYRQFLAALDSGKLLAPAGACANDFYEQSLAKQDLKPLFGAMRRNFAVALQDEVQQAINALLESDPYEVHNWRTNPEKYALYPAYLQRAMDLLGEKHYAFADLKAKKLYFEAHLMKKKWLDTEVNLSRQDSLRETAKSLLLEAHRLDGDAAFICHAIADLYLMNLPYRTDSLLVWMKKAVVRSPRWLLPLLDLSHEYQTSQSDFPNAEQWLLRAVEIDSQSIVVLERLSWLRQRQNRTDETIHLCKKIIEMKPDLPTGYMTLFLTYAFRREVEKMRSLVPKLKSFQVQDVGYGLNIGFSLFFIRNRAVGFLVSEAEADLKNEQAPRLIISHDHMGLGLVYTELGKWDSALEHIHWCEKNSIYPWYVMELQIARGKISYWRGNLAEAEALFRHSMTLDPAVTVYPKALAWLGVVAARRGEVQKADSLFQVAIHSWFGSAWDDFTQQEESHYLYGRFLIDQNRLDEAKEMFEKANELSFQNGYMGWYGLACLSAKQGDKTAALNFLEKSLNCWYPRQEPILEEPLFKKIRKTKRFKEMMGKHFPSGWEMH